MSINFLDVLLLCVNILGVFSAEASNSKLEPLKNSNAKFSDNEIEVNLMGHPHLYLPTETSGLPVYPSTYEAFTTSPPHLIISPTSVEIISTEQSTGTLITKDLRINTKQESTYISLCTSETPSTDQLQSKHLLPPKDLTLDSVILSGQIEIASKTGVADNGNFLNTASGASVPLQGTQIHVLSTKGV